MIKIYLLAGLTGLTMGPLYGFYCHFLSGKDVETLALFELTEDLTHSHPSGAIAAPFESGNVNFQLTPDMNPIAFNLKAQLYQIGPSTLQKNVNFSGTLKEGEQVAWQDSHRMTWKQSKKKGADLDVSKFARSVIGSELSQRTATVTTQLQVFDVEKAGNYTLSLAQTGKRDGEIATLHVTSRANVLRVNNKVFIPGCILLVLGAIASIYTHNKKKLRA